MESGMALQMKCEHLYYARHFGIKYINSKIHKCTTQTEKERENKGLVLQYRQRKMQYQHHSCIHTRYVRDIKYINTFSMGSYQRKMPQIYRILSISTLSVNFHWHDRISLKLWEFSWKQRNRKNNNLNICWNPINQVQHQ